MGHQSPYMTSLNSEHDCSAGHCTMVCWAAERLGRAAWRVSHYTHLAKLLLLWGPTSFNILMMIHTVLRKQETFTMQYIRYLRIYLQFVQYSFWFNVIWEVMLGLSWGYGCKQVWCVAEQLDSRQLTWQDNLYSQCSIYVACGCGCGRSDRW